MNNIISVGRKHCLVITSQSYVFAFGSNKFGQLGACSLEHQAITVITTIREPISVSACNNHSLVLDIYGQVWGFGSNHYGALGLPFLSKEHVRQGLGSYTYPYVYGNVYPIPMLIKGLSSIVAVSAGRNHSLFLDFQGRVWTTNIYRLTDVGIEEDFIKGRYQSDIVDGLPYIVSISAGFYHNLCIDENGCVWGFGNNKRGQMGINQLVDFIDPQMVPGLTDIVMVSGSEFHSIALDKQGNVWMFGYLMFSDEYKRLYPPTKISWLSDIISISAGRYRNIFMNRDKRYVDCCEDMRIHPGRSKPDDCGLFRGSIVKEIAAGDMNMLVIDEYDRVRFDGNLYLSIYDEYDIYDLYPSPVLFPDLFALHSSPRLLMSRKEIWTVYSIVRNLLDHQNIVDMRILEYTKEQDVIMEFEDNNGQNFIALVQYDPSTDKIATPNSSLRLVTKLRELIKKHKIAMDKIHLKFEGNPSTDSIVEFNDPTNGNRTCLIKIKYDSPLITGILTA